MAPSIQLSRRGLILSLASVSLAVPAGACGRPVDQGAGACSPPPPFGGIRFQSTLHVALDGRDDADGSERLPLRSLQSAADRAGPGVAILVHAGTYADPVKFPSRRGGTDTAPIWLISVDGPGAARLTPADPKQTAIKGLGVQNIVVQDFEIVGGDNGIQFSQAGADFSALCRNLVIRNNRISNVRQDGIKISQADNVHALHTHVENCGQQCVDYLNVWTGVIAGNDVSGAHVAAAVFAKGGSRDIWIVGNDVHDIAGEQLGGVAVGGWSGEAFVRPGSPPAEASNVIVSGNRIRRVDGIPLKFLGAARARASDNYLEVSPAGGQPRGPSFIGIGPGSPHGRMSLSSDVQVTGNVLVGERAEWLFERSSQEPGRDRLTVSRNRRGDAADAAAWPKAGAACQTPSASR